MSIKQVVTSLARVAISVLGGGLFYSLWLVAFLESSILQIAMWFLAPVVTAVGYALGIVLGERLTKASPTRFDRILIWPLIGCIVGAGIVVWFGPMLIVFGMFLLGTASVIMREWVMLRERTRAKV
jgi:hypothetical protein